MVDLSTLQELSLEELVRKKVRRRLATTKSSFAITLQSYEGVYSYSEGFGSNVVKYISAPKTQSLIIAIEKEVEEALADEPEINLNSVAVKNLRSNRLEVNVNYSIISSSQEENIVVEV